MTSSQNHVQILGGDQFHNLAEQELAKHSILMAKVHIQNIAWINAQFGNQMGDQVITTVRKALLNLERSYLVGEISPTLFGIACLQPEDPNGLIADISHALSEINTNSHWPFLVELAFGVIVANNDVSKNIHHWITRANTALMVSARKGQGVIYDESQDLFQKIRFELGKLRVGDNPPEGMRWVYQPVVETDSGKMIGFEALVRWDSPTLGSLSPDVFIPIAEEMGVIHIIDRWALMATTSACHTFDALNIESVGVNVSAKTFEHDRRFVDFVSNLVATCGVNHGQLVLEITETAVLENLLDASAIVQDLKDRGIEVAIDDFGKGETSLMNIATLQVDYLKLDKSLLRLPNLAVKGAMLKIGADIGASLGVKVLCEGIETQEDWDLVKAAGIPLAQGYFFGHPQPLEYYLKNE